MIDAQYAALQARVTRENWSDVRLERDEDLVYVHLAGRHNAERYLAKIDTTRYPVEPYDFGFLPPDIPSNERRRISSKDPRYWPWSPIPGEHGSFVLFFPRAIRVLWCREYTADFFFYHGHERSWAPADWPLERVVAYLRQAVNQAVHPSRWRRIHRPNLEQAAAALQVVLPPHAGLDDA